MKSKCIKIVLACVLVVSLLAACNGGAAPAAPAPAPAADAAAPAPAADGAAPASPGIDASEIRIGIIAPLTGGAAVFGIASSNGTQLAFREINADGGILGVPIRYILYDDMHSAVDSVQAFARQVHDDNVVAVVGPVTSGPATAVTQSNVETRIPMVTPTATAYGVTTPGDFIFRACFLDAQQAIAVADFAFNDLGARTAAVLFDVGMDYSTGLAENFRDHFQAIGGNIISWESYMTGDVDFRPQLTSIRDANPDVLFFPDYFSAVALMAAQVNELGLEATLLGGDGWEGVFTVLDDPNVLNVSFYSAHFSADDQSPLVQNFISNFTQNFGEPPNSFAALGYDAGRIMAQAIEEAGSLDNEAIISALQNLRFSGVTGDIYFDPNGNPIKAVVITAIDGGQARLQTKIEP